MGAAEVLLLNYCFAGDTASYSIQSIGMSAAILSVDGALAATAFWFIGLHGARPARDVRGAGRTGCPTQTPAHER